MTNLHRHISIRKLFFLLNFIILYTPTFLSHASLISSQSSLSSLPSPARGDSEEIHGEDDTHYAAIIKIGNEEAVKILEEAGVYILRRRENHLLCFIPIVSNDTRGAGHASPESIEGVIGMERSRRVSASMDMARRWFDAYTLNSGEASGTPYTGAGTVTGLCDIGIDPFHIAFLNPDGSCRIKRIVQYKEGSGERILLEFEKDFREWETDTDDEWHATHVANIMAGSAAPYMGMAPDSEIVVSTSQLTDVGLLCGAEDILDYAKEKGKRAVINMSMANYLGPHDGSSLFSQYIDLLGEEAVVVLSAGNAGNTDFTLSYSFTHDGETAALALYSSDWVQFTPRGAVDIWSSDNRSFQVRFGVQDGEKKEIMFMYPWQRLYNGDSFKVTTEEVDLPSSEKEQIIFDARLKEIFDGWFSLTGEIDSENGRYRAMMEFYAKTEIASSKGPWARYIPVVEIAGEAGVHVDIYADYQHTNFRSLPGGPTPGSLLSFSDLASGFNTISVGMFTNRNHRPSLSGEVITGKYPAGEVSPYSSYSTLSDGRVMPQTVAPGGAVVSAISSHFLNKHPQGTELNALTTKGGENYYWASNTGTSMSAPYVAGSIACWLEAVPSLSPKEIQEIIAISNRHDYPDSENPRHGSGWFDAVAGLKEAINRHSGIDAADADSPSSLRLSFDGHTLTIWNPAGDTANIEVFNAAGMKVATLRSDDPTAYISTVGFSPGIYIALITGTEKSLRFLVR